MMQDDNEKEEKSESGTDIDIGIRFEDDVDEPSESTAETDESGSAESISLEAEKSAGSHSNIAGTLQDLLQQMHHLSDAFDTKLKYDEHKNKIIDELHRELQEFREGIIKKHLHSMITDTIKIIDDIRKLKVHYESVTPTENTIPDLLNSMEDIASDLEDQFSWQGVLPYTCEGDHFDYTRQRVVKKIETRDPDLDKKIAGSIRPGYEWEGKVIRPEMVAVYIHNDASSEEGIAE